MIVNQINSGWEIIFQRAHEMLAMQIAQNWKKDKRPARWAELLSAIAEHDNRQEGWKGSRHLNKAGAPIDFSQKGFLLEQAKGVTDVAGYKSRFVALLISMHTSYLYEPLRGSDQETDQFLDQQLENQKAWIKSLQISKAAANKAYNLMHWADRCSLILCKEQLPPDARKLEIFKDPDDNPCFIWQRKNGSLGVDPWPFEEEEFEVWVESRSLNKVIFKDDQDLANTLLAAKVEEKKWIFKKY